MPVETPAGRRGRAGVLLPLLLLSTVLPAAAEPWYRSYERAQRLLLSEDFAAAEAALSEAVTERPLPGCRLRTYGVRVRDYVPWYYLGVALAGQGRDEEAREAFRRASSEGIVQDCPGTQLQALDLLDRLDRLDRHPAERPGESALADLAPLRAAALAAGAEEAAAELVAKARRLEEGCGGACDEAARAWLAALSRARVERPILILLERSARESLAAADLALRQASEGKAEARAALATARERLAGASSARDWLAVERASTKVLELLRPAPSPAEPPAEPRVRSGDRGAALRAAIGRAEGERELLLEASASTGDEPEGLAAADRDLEAARSLLAAGEGAATERGLVLAERARSAFARSMAVGRGSVGEETTAALVELPWSALARVPKPAVLPPELER